MKFIKSPILHVILLIALTWLVFNRTLGSYFLADDFGEVAYISRIKDGGEIALIWANFTGNYMQIPSMAVWRPWLLISLLADYLVWGANPFGFYLTNLLSYNLCIVLYYLFLRKLTESFSPLRSGLSSLLCAALFAVSPLHCESISWVVGRVDIVSSVFYLAALNLLFAATAHFDDREPKKYRSLMAFSLLSFVIAMWTKEMPIGLPVLAPVLFYLFKPGGKPGLRDVLRFCLPLWTTTVVYFIGRYLALKTILGGYVQGIGDAQAAQALSRWLDLDTLKRLFYPFAFHIFGSDHLYHKIFTVLFAVLLVVAVLRLTAFRPPLKLLVFLPIWIVTTLLPIYKLWGLGYELEGARFCYFLTLPLCALPLILLAPARPTSERPLPLQVLTALASLTLLIMLAVLLKAAQLSNLAWVQTGKEVREFCEKSRQLSNAVILGIPKRRGGAHMILNSITFAVVNSPPFSKASTLDQVYLFDPVIFGNDWYLNTARLRKLLQEHPDCRIKVWNSATRDFIELKQATQTSAETAKQTDLAILSKARLKGELRARTTKEGLLLQDIKPGDALVFDELDIETLRGGRDTLWLKLKPRDKAGQSLAGGKFKVRLSSADDQAAVLNQYEIEAAAAEAVLLPLGENWRYFAVPKISRLTLELPVGTDLLLQEAALIDEETIRPTITVADLKIDERGVYSRSKGPVDLKIDCQKLRFQPSGLVLEITKPNSFFQNMEQGRLDLAESIDISGKDQIQIAPEKLETGVYQEVRVRPLYKKGEPLLPSAPVNLRLD